MTEKDKEIKRLNLQIEELNQQLIKEMNSHLESIDLAKKTIMLQEKEIKKLRDALKNKILKMRADEFMQLCISCGVMIEAKEK